MTIFMIAEINCTLYFHNGVLDIRQLTKVLKANTLGVTKAEKINWIILMPWSSKVDRMS
jgi:hypothetical protein